MSPDDIARLAAKTMWAADKAGHALGIEIVEVGPGHSTLAMVVRDDMLNGHDMAHGGFIFTLADTAFAYACNSGGNSTVAAQCQVTYLAPGKLGDRLVARAKVIAGGGRSGLTDVTVTAGDMVIAEFRGYSRTIGGSFLPANGEG